jgi:outer membrane protein OmpA-like peptidoglycan-associated protein
MLLTLLLGSSVFAFADDCKRIANILILFDASGHMKSKGQYEALLKQMEFFTQALPVTADGFFNVGLRHYGLKVGLGCENTESILPVGPWDPDRFMNAFPKTISHGVSSLSAGLRAAADEAAGLSGKTAIVVVGSGIESCRMDPIKIAQQVVANNPDLEIHTFQLGGGTEGAYFLRGIAELGRGTYTALDDPNTPTLWYAWMKKNLVMPCPPTVQPPGMGAVQAIPPVTFDPNSISVKSKDPGVNAANVATIQAVAQILRATPTARVVLHGYSAEGKGNVKQSLRMSRKRAEAVAHLLIGTYGIPSTQVGLVAHGAVQDKGGRVVEFEIAR